ncbi:MAG: hypothetical protein ABSF64_34790 [Bryobacteraceae bacterium]|jgi:hypothetical protein
MQGLSRALLLMACCAPWALGQDTDGHTYPKLEYFAGYSAIDTNNHTFFFSEFKPVTGLDYYDEHGQGFDAEVIRNVSRYFSIVGDFSAHLSYNRIPVQQAKGTQDIKINPELFDFLAGPEVNGATTPASPLLPMRFSVLPTPPPLLTPADRLPTCRQPTHRPDLRWPLTEDSSSGPRGGSVSAAF